MKPSNVDNPNNKRKLVDANGIQLEVVENAEYKENPNEVSFYDWVAKQPTLPTAQMAWSYKCGEILAITQDWEESVLFGKERLKDTIDSVTELNNELTKKVARLEGENTQLRKEIDELGSPVQNSF